MVLKLYYTRNSYNVSYAYTNDPAITGAPSLPATAEYKYGAEVTVAAVPTMAGYTFSNSWTTSDATVENGKITMPAKAVAFEGTWTANNYTVTFNA